MGHEETYARDLLRRSEIERELTGLSDGVASRLRRHGLAGRTVTLKVRFADFRTITRSVTGTEPLDEAPALLRAARGLLEGIDTGDGVRLLGVSVSGLGGRWGPSAHPRRGRRTRRMGTGQPNDRRDP